MKMRTLNERETGGSSLRSEILQNNLIDSLKESEYNTDYQRKLKYTGDVLALTDSRKFDGAYKQDDGSIILVYVSHGWMYKYYLISQEQLNQLQSREVTMPTPQNVYFEF